MARSRAGYSVRAKPHSEPHSLAFERFLRVAHVADRSCAHALDRVVAVAERELQWLDDFNRVPVRFDPNGDPSVRLIEVFEDQFAPGRPIECEHNCAEWPQNAADTAGHAGLHMALVDDLAAQSAGDGAIGCDEGRIRSQAHAFKNWNRVGCAAARGNGNDDAGFLGCTERTRIPLG